MFIQSRIDAYDKSIADDTNINKFTIKDAIYMIAEAWSGVSQLIAGARRVFYQALRKRTDWNKSRTVLMKKRRRALYCRT